MSDLVLRRLLLATAIFNLGIALVIASYPSSLVEVSGLPPSAPLVYRLMLAYLIALFGLCYLWLWKLPTIDPSWITFAAIGKLGTVLVIFGCWLAGAATARLVLLASGDLFFAFAFGWWLRTTGGRA